MRGHYIQIAASDRTFGAYHCRPLQLPAPGVIVLQEIFGVNEFIRDVVHQMSDAGFNAIAPLLYWRQRSDVELDCDNEADMKTALSLLGKLNEGLAVEDAMATMDYLRSLPECTGSVGAMGYCLGGKLAYLMAARSSIDAAVAYYGTGIHADLNEAAGLKAPLLLHIAGKDFLCPPDAQKQIRARMSELKAVLKQETKICVYEGAEHGFTRRGKSMYDPEASKIANARTVEFFNTHLRGLSP